jgi:hypothetical protein
MNWPAHAPTGERIHHWWNKLLAMLWTASDSFSWEWKA